MATKKSTAKTASPTVETTDAAKPEGEVVGTQEVVKEPTKDDIAAGDAVANETDVDQPGAGKGDETEKPEVQKLFEGELVSHPYCDAISDYARNMAANCVVTPAEILTHQMSLYQAITNMVNNLGGKDFHDCYKQALLIMEEKPSAFEDRLVFRQIANMRVPAATRQRFENIVILMTSTATRSTRAAALETIDFKVLCEGFTQEVEQKLRGFYSN